MPFRREKINQTGHIGFHWKTKKNSFKKTCREEINGTKDLDLRTKHILPVYLFPSCFKNVILNIHIKVMRSLFANMMEQGVRGAACESTKCSSSVCFCENGRGNTQLAANRFRIRSFGM